MKGIPLKGVLILLLLVFSATTVFAADTSLKIGVVDLNKAVNESEQGKKAKSELQQFIKAKQDALDEKGRSLEKLKSELETQSGVMSDQARKKKEDELSRLTTEYQRAASDSQGEVRKKERELTGRIVTDLKKMIEVIARDNNFSLVLDYNPTVVIAADSSIDITDMVIKKFDESQNANKAK